jgi:hypothetical protein
MSRSNTGGGISSTRVSANERVVFGTSQPLFSAWTV